MTCLYKCPQNHNIYWVIEETRAYESKLVGWVLYHQITCNANAVEDKMACRALITKGSVAFWVGDLLVDAPSNQFLAVYLY